MENTSENSHVRIANINDVVGVLAVQDGLLFSKEREVSQGFLWYPLKEEELKEIIAHPENHVLIVSEIGGKINGYFLAYNLEEWENHKSGWFD